MKILIVKLGAMGDVLRTTPLLQAYRRAYPSCQIDWVVEKPNAVVLENNPNIDRLMMWGEESLQYIREEHYDLAINLDKEPEALDSIEAANADVKKGFGWDGARKRETYLNDASRYAVQLGVDDDLKFRTNQKTYQQISYEQVELPYEFDDYQLYLTEADQEYADKHLRDLGFDFNNQVLYGINTGSGHRFAGKRLPEESVAELSAMFHRQTGQRVLLLGGPDEHERNQRIEKMCPDFAVNAGTRHSIRQFAGIVKRLGLVVSGDTIAMHIAIAVKTPVLAFFGSTCEPEIELYGRGRTVRTSVECAPCYKRNCPTNEECMSGFRMDDFCRISSEILKQHSGSNV